MEHSIRDNLSRLVLFLQSSNIDYREAVDAFRREWLTQALEDNNGNLCRTARRLRMHRNTLARVLTILDLDAKAIRQAK